MITFGDIPLLCPTEEVGREALEHINRYLPFEEARLFGSTTQAHLTGLIESRTQSQKHIVPLPVYNWPERPEPRINTLYWPSGASRWACGWFLATGEAKDSIVQLAHSPGGTAALTLAFGDDEQENSYHSVQRPELYLLPPRPVSGIDPALRDLTEAEGKETLWLLPLVDVRYFWQFVSSGDLEIESGDSWATLFSDLGTALGVTISADTVDSAYLKPDPEEFTRRYVPVPLLLDAAAASVGQRITRAKDGTVKSQSVSTARTNLDTNYQNKQLAPGLSAGGDYSRSLGDLPENVRVNFRRYSQYQVYCGGEVYTKTSAASAVTADYKPASTVSGKDKIVLSSLFAEYPAGTAANSASTPTNSSDLTALADQVAKDYYGWLSKRFDLAYSGMIDWTFTGFDDAVVWDYSHGRTRVWSLAADVGVSQQLSQDEDYELLETIELGKPDSDIAAGDDGTVSVWRRNSSGTLADSTLNVTANALGGDVASGLYASLWWNCGEWLVSCYES